MDGRMLVRLGAVVLAAVAITAAAVEMARKEDGPAPRQARTLEPVRDSVREGQRRCQRLGESAARDADCLRVWAETRDRFLGRTSPPPSAGGR